MATHHHHHYHHRGGGGGGGGDDGCMERAFEFVVIMIIIGYILKGCS